MNQKSSKLYTKLITSALVAGSIVMPAFQTTAFAEGSDYFAVNNNVGTADTVTFFSAKAKDVVKVYSADGNTLLGSGKASKAGDLTVKLKNQLTESSVQVSLTNYNKRESEKVDVDVPEETTTESLSSDNIVVNNNVGTADTIVVSGVKAKDVVRVYNAAGEILLGSAKASKDGAVTIKLRSQLAEDTVQVSLSTYNSLESDKIDAEVPEEMASDELSADSITVSNNVGNSDTVFITGLKAKDVVKVYNASGETLLGTGKVSKDGDLTVKLKAQLAEESVQVSLTSYNKIESEKVDAEVPEETTTEALTPETIIVNNNVDMADTVVVPGRKAKDVVKVYNGSGETLLGTAKASKGGDVTVKLKAQLTEEGIVQVSLTSYNSLEGEKVDVDVPEEEITEFPN
ncbi:hypothetical protein [Fictibacillus sp. FJAT-27399]|uniref:hypothetical protein n=1 Tax=Fictibacillus sp. FJAT-27399 TaxID=1729689 RepID=UPI000782C5CB|nr:hypothetical protein [Fictibacillus sp. FJAT-27399]